MSFSGIQGNSLNSLLSAAITGSLTDGASQRSKPQSSGKDRFSSSNNDNLLSQLQQSIEQLNTILKRTNTQSQAQKKGAALIQIGQMLQRGEISEADISREIASLGSLKNNKNNTQETLAQALGINTPGTANTLSNSFDKSLASLMGNSSNSIEETIMQIMLSLISLLDTTQGYEKFTQNNGLNHQPDIGNSLTNNAQNLNNANQNYSAVGPNGQTPKVRNLGGKKVFVIDAGHGNGDPGAVVGGLTERRLIENVMKHIKKFDNKNDDVEIILTNGASSQDKNGKYTANMDKVKQQLGGRAPDGYVQVHFNSASGNPSGREALHLGDSGSANLSKSLVDNTAHTGIKSRGTKVASRGSKTLKNAKARGIKHAAIWEGGFMQGDRNKIVGHEEKHAQGIVAGIINFANSQFA